jgi:hypothetical protein
MEARPTYAPVVKQGLDTTMARMKAGRPSVMQQRMELLKERYDLSHKPATGAIMSGSEAIQEGVRLNPVLHLKVS